MPLDKNGKYNLNPMDGARDTEAKAAPEVAAPAKEQAGDDGVQIHITKKPEGGYHSKVDSGDELGPDEQDHESLSEANSAAASALEAKFGEKAVEEAEEEVSPGIHEKVEEKLEGDKGGLLAGMKR